MLKYARKLVRLPSFTNINIFQNVDLVWIWRIDDITVIILLSIIFVEYIWSGRTYVFIIVKCYVPLSPTLLYYIIVLKLYTFKNILLIVNLLFTILT